jgi:hypothetical protein
MMTISLVIPDPLHLTKETMHWIRTMVLQSTVRRERHPGSRNFLLLKDNRRLRRESLAVTGKYLLDLTMSMGINGIPSIYIERIDVVLLESNVRMSGRTLPPRKIRIIIMSKWFLDLALLLPEIATMTRLQTQSHSWLN